jgi:hypothetical protein
LQPSPRRINNRCMDTLQETAAAQLAYLRELAERIKSASDAATRAEASEAILWLIGDRS